MSGASTVTNKRPPMTAAEARRFLHVSVGNAIAVTRALDCGCEPYEDVFTYTRWQAQGMQVQRGQHSISLPLIKDVSREDADTGEISHRRIMGSSHVFCRCQVAERTERGA